MLQYNKRKKERKKENRAVRRDKAKTLKQTVGRSVDSLLLAPIIESNEANARRREEGETHPMRNI